MSSTKPFFLPPSFLQASSKIFSTCLLIPRLSGSRDRAESRKTGRGSMSSSPFSSGCNLGSSLSSGKNWFTPEYSFRDPFGTDVRKTGPRGWAFVLAISKKTGMSVAEMLTISCAPRYELVVCLSFSMACSSFRLPSSVRSIASASSMKMMKRPSLLPSRCKACRMRYTLPLASAICDAVSDTTMQLSLISISFLTSSLLPFSAYAMHRGLRSWP